MTQFWGLLGLWDSVLGQGWAHVLFTGETEALLNREVAQQILTELNRGEGRKYTVNENEMNTCT